MNCNVAILLLASSAWCVAGTELVAFDEVGTGAFKGLVDEMASQVSGPIDAPRRCWEKAINVLSEHVDLGATPLDFCGAMTQFQQDVLALELALCQMEKSRTPFIIKSDPKLEADCAWGKLADQRQVDICLSHLDENSYNIYVQFTMHVQQLCVRFTDELVTARKEQAALLLAQSSHAVSKQLANLMEKNDELIRKVAQQQELLEDQSLKIQQFNDVIENITMHHIQPINSFFRHSSKAILLGVSLCSWAVQLIFPTVSLALILLLTMSSMSRGSRSFLINLVLLEAVMEILSNWAVNNDYIGKDDRENCIDLLRKAFVVAELFAYSISIFLSFSGLMRSFFSGWMTTSKPSASLNADPHSPFTRASLQTGTTASERLAEILLNHKRT